MSPEPRQPSARQRNALIPGVIMAAALIAGIPLIGSGAATVISYIVAIFALIIAWFAVQARQWWWAVPTVAIAVLWNPVYPFAFDGAWWIAAHVIAAAVGIAAGASISIPRPGTSDRG